MAHTVRIAGGHDIERGVIVANRGGDAEIGDKFFAGVT